MNKEVRDSLVLEIPQAEQAPPQRTSDERSAGLLLAAGLLGLLGAGFVLLAPELGIATSVIAGTISGAGSAGVTLLARK